MKFYIHYTWWNKESQVKWALDALMFFDNLVIDFVFDNPKDNSIFQFTNHPIHSKHKVKHFVSDKKLRWPNTNDAIERFLKSDCDVFLTPQDDMKIQDKFILTNIENLLSKEHDVGVIGMRDGILGGSNFYSSCHSPGGPKKSTTYIRNGEYKTVDYVNDGPIALHRSTIEKVGLFDTEYWAHFGDNDYCFRSSEKGLVNYVMGAEIVHEKFGNVIQSEVWSQEYSNHDWEVYRRKWPNKQ